MAIKVEPITWYTAAETADLLGCSEKTLEAERRTGDGVPYSKIGKRIYYLGSDIDSFLSGRRQRSTADRPMQVGGRP